MSHITGTVQPVTPVRKIGPDFGPSTSPNTWTVNFAYTPAPTGTKLVMLHFTGASLPASNRLEVDLGYTPAEMDVFTSADGTDFWTRPIDVYAVGATVTIRYITNGAATGGVQLDQYGRGERHTKDPDPGLCRRAVRQPEQLRSPSGNCELCGAGLCALLVLQRSAELGECRLRDTGG